MYVDNTIDFLPVSLSFYYVTGFPYEKVVQRVLYLQVLDYDRFSRNDPIGEVSIPLNKIDLTQMQTFWKELKPCSDGSVRYNHFFSNHFPFLGLLWIHMQSRPATPTSPPIAYTVGCGHWGSLTFFQTKMI